MDIKNDYEDFIEIDWTPSTFNTSLGILVWESAAI